MEIYVIRHTRVSIEKGTCYGQFDVPLNSNFLQDIATLKYKLPNDFDKIFSSPLKRCSLLAEHISLEGIEYHDSLKEMSFGSWENKTWDSIDSELLNEWMDNFVFTKTPEGESLYLLYERVSLFIDQLRSQKYGKIALVTHAGVIRCLWAYVLNIPLESIFKIPIDYGEGMIFKLGDNKSMDQIVKTSL
ncbi:putative phosphoserine phosphatase 2 [compost metagenome]